MASNFYSYIFKYIVIGDTGVGKVRKARHSACRSWLTRCFFVAMCDVCLCVFYYRAAFYINSLRANVRVPKIFFFFFSKPLTSLLFTLCRFARICNTNFNRCFHAIFENQQSFPIRRTPSASSSAHELSTLPARKSNCKSGILLDKNAFGMCLFSCSGLAACADAPHPPLRTQCCHA
jgi:hypothetical protein